MPFARKSIFEEVWAYSFVAFAADFGASLLGMQLGWNAVVANIAAAGVMAVFGWRHRKSDVLELIVPALVVAYCAYLGLVVARIQSTSVPTIPEWHGVLSGPLINRLPLVLFGGVVYAAMLTIAVALPMSKIRVSKPEASAEPDTMGTYLHQLAERPAPVKSRATPDRDP
jgi:hypothetical protein